MKTYKMESISILLQKPKARTQVYEALKETNILYEVEKFMLSAFFIALKRSKRRDIHKTILSVKVIMKATNNTPIETWKIESLVNHIVNQDENQLKSFAAERAKESVQVQKDDANFLMGLFRF
jgi:hypothetical protein